MPAYIRNRDSGLLPHGCLTSDPRARDQSSVGFVDWSLLPYQTSVTGLKLPPPRLPQRASSARIAAIVSTLIHVLVAATVALIAVHTESFTSVPSATPDRQPVQPVRLVFLTMPQRGGGGGGGGNRQYTPPTRAAGIGLDRLTVPAVNPPVTAEKPSQLTEPLPPLVLDARPLASGQSLLIGLPDTQASFGSQGSGRGGGVGEGTGTGIGPGTGPGVGRGSAGGFGSGAYRPGSSVISPTLIKDVRPKYTEDGLRRAIQGTVALEIVVGRSGIPLDVRVTRSLDPGLDEEAIAAVRQWRFTPGRVADRPVEVLVTIFIDFRLR